MWVTKPFQNWKKAVQKMKEHASSESHLRQVEAEMIVSRGETVVHQLQCFGDSERSKNRKAIKALLGCTHYLCKQHIPHITIFSKLIDLIVSCGGKDLEEFVRKAAKNASYTSTDAVTDFVEAIGVWVDELQVNMVCNAPFFSLMADECVDVANIEELSVYSRWVKNGVPVEHFMEILPLKKMNAQSIYSVLLDWLKKCVSTVKKCYGAIVSALETIYQESHEPEALGISKILSKPSTLFAIYLLDYIRPEVSKLSKSLQTEKLDLSIISSLVDATLHTLEDVLQPAAKWVLDLQEVKEEMDITVGINNLKRRWILL